MNHPANRFHVERDTCAGRYRVIHTTSGRCRVVTPSRDVAMSKARHLNRRALLRL